MSYTKTVWKDLPDTTTPITADRLNNIENGVEYLFENTEAGIDIKNVYSNLQNSVYSCNYVNNNIQDVYSTNEIKTNKVWINNKPIYRKTFNRGNDLSSFNHNIANVDMIWIDSTHSIRKHQSGNVFNLIGGTNDSTIKLGIYVNDTEVHIDNVGSLTPSEIYITLEYTKTTD